MAAAKTIWAEAVAAHDDALAALAFALREDGPEDELTAADHAACAALERLLATRAPDVAAIAEKARRGINAAYAELAGEHADDPDTLTRLLTEPALGGGPVIASLFQDALALSGDTGPLSLVTSSAWRPDSWLAEVAETTGATITLPEREWEFRIDGKSDQVRAGSDELEALKPWQTDRLRMHLIQAVP